MTKKVLGNDPFATEGETDATPTASTSSKPSARPSARPSTRPSKTPSAKPSKRPSRAAKASGASAAGITAPKAPRIPIEATAIEAYVAEEQLGEAVVSPTTAEATPQQRETLREPVMSMVPPSDEDVVGSEASVHQLHNVDEDLAPNKVDDGPTLPVDEQIKRLEQQLDSLLKKKDEPRVRTVEETKAAERKEEQRLDDVGELASSEYFAKQWGRVAMRDRAEEVDEFGMDREFQLRSEAIIDLLYTKWWRVETHGISEVPSDGRVILCANHAGAVPYDGMMLAAALRREHPAKRELRWLADDFVFHFPFMGVALNRLGAVRACQENAERLLRHANVVGVFPEGVKGISKSMGQHYALQRFGRGGHVKLALRTQTPIVPVAIVGSEETHPLLPTGLLAKLFNVSFLPITPTFPWLGALGLIPLPSKWSISFLEPIDVASYGPDAAEDDVLVGRINEKIRTMIQDELALRTRQRKGIFRG